jgi:hypothetical protein
MIFCTSMRCCLLLSMVLGLFCICQIGRVGCRVLGGNGSRLWSMPARAALFVDPCFLRLVVRFCTILLFSIVCRFEDPFLPLSRILFPARCVLNIPFETCDLGLTHSPNRKRRLLKNWHKCAVFPRNLSRSPRFQRPRLNSSER